MIRRCSFLQKLADWLPGDLDHCFFSDSGSVGVEVALKMALQYYVNQGDMERTKVLALQNAYHGDTFKAMEVGDDEDYHFILEAYGEKKYVINIPTEIPALEEAFAKHQRTQLHDRGTASAGGCGYADVRCVIFTTCAGAL